MKLLVLQTPKLTYLQVLTLLRREIKSWSADLVLLPEYAMEHPAQVTHQGELSMHNVALLLLARFAKQHKLYIVLGSLEEVCLDGRHFDTCVVISPDGEMVLRYRKMSAGLGRNAGEEPGLFSTPHGTIGILLGAEVREEQRWGPILAASPRLVLNPTRSPVVIDSVLARAHPELEVSSWHSGFERLDKLVDSFVRGGPISFVRADAPFHQGGAGLSIFVEPHRTVMAPCWSACFLRATVTKSGEMEARRPPGWRLLSIDEKIAAATRDRQLLLREEVFYGPRMRLWTLLPQTLLAHKLRRKAFWTKSWSPEEVKADAAVLPQDQFATQAPVRSSDSSSDECEGGPSYYEARAAKGGLMVPIHTRDGRSLFASSTLDGSITLWDVKLKKEWQMSSFFGATSEELVVTAMGPGRTPTQFIVAGAMKGESAGLLLRVFDEGHPIHGIHVSLSSIPWRDWLAFEPSDSDEEEEASVSAQDSAEEGPTGSRRAGSKKSPFMRRPFSADEPIPDSIELRAVYHIEPLVAMAVAEAGTDRPPAVLLISLDKGHVTVIDIFGDGPREEVDEPRSDSDIEVTDLLDPVVQDHVRGTYRSGDHGKGRQTVSKNLLDNAQAFAKYALPGFAVANDPLVAVQLLEQRFSQRKTKPTRCVMCLYESNRVCLLAYDLLRKNEWDLVEHQLSDGSHLDKLRMEVPLSATAVPSATPGAFHLVVSYASKLVKWWQVSLSGFRQQANIVLSGALCRICAMERPVAGTASTLPGGKALAASPKPSEPEHPGGRATPKPRQTHQAPCSSPTMQIPHFLIHRTSTSPSGHSKKAGIAHLEADLSSAHGMPSPKSLRPDPVFDGLQSQSTAAGLDPGPELELSTASLMIFGIDARGTMPVLVARDQTIREAFQATEFETGNDTRVEQLFALERGLAAQLTDSTVIDLEFVLDDEVVRITDLPLDV